MIKVLHYDYRRDEAGDFIVPILNEFALDDNIDYDLFLGYSFIPDSGRLERMLPEKDVLLIHSGLSGQRVVGKEYPLRFPNLKIGILSFIPEHYTDAGNVSVLDYRNTQSIVDFVNSAKKSF